MQLAQGHLDGVSRQHGGAAAPSVEQADRERGKKEPLRGTGAEGLEGRTDELGGEDLGVVPTRESAEPGSPGANVEAAQAAAGERVQRLNDPRGAQWGCLPSGPVALQSGVAEDPEESAAEGVVPRAVLGGEVHDRARLQEVRWRMGQGEGRLGGSPQ